MKMDCYPRFKKSPLVKECLLAEMEGKPLPIDLPQEQRKDQQQTRFTGIWSKHRVSGAGRSIPKHVSAMISALCTLFKAFQSIHFLFCCCRSLVSAGHFLDVSGEGVSSKNSRHRFPPRAWRSGG